MRHVHMAMLVGSVLLAAVIAGCGSSPRDQQGGVHIGDPCR